MGGDRPIKQLPWRPGVGDGASWEQLIPVLYEDLRRIARQRLRFDYGALTLGTTALVNECYVRLVQSSQVRVEDRHAFLAAASETMRRVLVDYARARKRQKRGGGQAAVPLDEVEPWLSETESNQVLRLHDALETLAAMDGRAARVLELRFFGGLSLEETAQVLEISVKTVQRVWLTARAWLRKEIGSA